MKKLLFIAALLCLTTVLSAQDFNDSLNIKLDEVVVTSIYKKTSSGNSELKSDRITSMNYGQEPSNMFIKMPSIISLNDNGTEFGYGYFRIRGLDQTRINVSLDGCPWNEAEDYGSYFANSPDLLSSMSSVSVERGSSSMYNGIAGVAGGILLESVNLYKDTVSHISFDTGSYGSYRASVVYNMGNINNWGLHIKATSQETEGYRDNSQNSSKAFTIKTGYKFNDNHSVDLMTMNGYHENGQGWIGSTMDELSRNKYANGCLESEDDEWFMTMNRLQYKGWLSSSTLLTSSVYYQYQRGSYRMDLDNYMRKMVDKSWESTYALYDYGLTHHMYGGNFVVKQSLNDFNITGGVNLYQYFRKHYMDDKTINVSESEYYDNKGTKNDLSSFIQLKYALDNLSVSGNIQYRHVEFKYKDYMNDIYSFGSYKNGTRWDFLNYGLNVDYLLGTNSRAFLSYSHVNREPTRSDMFGGNETYTGELATIESEKSNDVEAGFEYKNNKIKLSVNYFYMWFDNELVLNGEYGLNGLPCHENASSSYRTGIEVSMEAKPVKNINFLVNASRSTNRVKTDTYGSKNHIMSPEWTFDSDLMYIGEHWNIGCNVNYHSDMYIDMNNEYKVPDMFTFNMYGEIEPFTDMFIKLRMNNITNRKNYNTAMLGVDNEIRYIQNAGFNFNVSLRMDF